MYKGVSEPPKGKELLEYRKCIYLYEPCVVGCSTIVTSSPHDLSLMLVEVRFSDSWLKTDSNFHPYEFGKMSTPACWGGGGGICIGL